MNVINQRDGRIETFQEGTKDLTALMSISLSSSDESIAPSTSKQIETVQSFVLADSDQKETSRAREPNQTRKCKRKGVNKKFKVNNLILSKIYRPKY